MCAIFGVFNLKNAAQVTAVGLHGNQHRAIDQAGMVTSHAGAFHLKYGKGLARQVFTPEALAALPGENAIGHLRYPTVVDDNTRINVQPIIGKYCGVPIAIAHNGNLTNVDELAKLVHPSQITSSIDTEYIVRILEKRDSGNLEDDLTEVLRLLKGSFSLAIMTPYCMIAVRDRTGNRPLSIGTIEDGYCISSETCAFPPIGTSEYHEIEPGTMEIMNSKGKHSKKFAEADEKRCRFESIYFSHPFSVFSKEPVDESRLKIGKALAEHCPVEDGADIVTPIPDSSNFIAMGFAQQSQNCGDYFPVIIRSHYSGRTFIVNTQARRLSEVTQKFIFSAERIRGKRIVVIDDSIVRGNTMPTIVSLLRQLGAKAVHVRIGSPPIRYSCRYGINTPTTEELISSTHSPEEIRKKVGADSLQFLPLDVLKSLSSKPESFCYTCMNGNYW